MANERQNDMDRILAEVGARSEGTDINALLDATRLPRATLLRRIKALRESGRLRVEGAGKATRYHLAPSDAKTRRIEEVHAPGIPFSEASEKLRDRLRVPFHLRMPVGYDRARIESYEPNVSWLVDPATRSRLQDVGRAGVGSAEPAGTHARRILDRLLIDLSWNSSRLEGNTYSLLDTRALLQDGLARSDLSDVDRQMILNHKSAIEFLVEGADDIGFTPQVIRNLHAILADNLLSDQAMCGGLRREPVEIGESKFIPLDNPQLLDDHFNLLLAKIDAVLDPFEQSFLTLAFIPYLQPFVDSNKRTSRLAANIPFIKKNLSPISFIDVPERDYIDAILAFYEFDRTDLLRDLFVWAYERSATHYRAVRQSLGDPDPFRLKFRVEIMEAVMVAVRDRKTDVVRLVQRLFADRIAGSELNMLIQTVETELSMLHEGNFARFRIRPSEYQAWRDFVRPQRTT